MHYLNFWHAFDTTRFHSVKSLCGFADFRATNSNKNWMDMGTDDSADEDFDDTS